MTDYTWPTDIAPKANTLEWVDATARFTSASAAMRTKARNAGYWRLVMSFDDLLPQYMQPLEAFLWRLDGSAHRAIIPDHSYRRQGTGTGTPLVDGAGQTGYSLVTDGWSGTDPVLLAGDRFSLNGQLCVVAVDCTPSAGAATIVLCHPLREAPPDNDPLEVDLPVARFAMVSRSESAAREGLVKSVLVEFEEALGAVVAEESYTPFVTEHAIYITWRFTSTYRLELATAWDITSASQAGNTDGSSYLSTWGAIRLSSDNTRAYVLEDDFVTVIQSSLDTATDITTALDDAESSISLSENISNDFCFRDNGTRLYLLDDQSNRVKQWTLTSAWDVTNLSSLSSKVLSDLSGARSITIGNSGTKMYIVEQSSITEYTLGTAWSISTAAKVTELDISDRSQDSRGVAIDPTGTTLFVGGTDGSGNPNRILQYTLGTPWSIATASYAAQFDLTAIDPDFELGYGMHVI